MAYENQVQVLSGVQAGADLRTHQFKAVKFSGGAFVLGAAGDNCAGFLQNKPNTGEAADYATYGVTRAIASAAIAQGAKVACAASGKVATAATGNHVLGIALEAAAADNDIIAVLITLGGAPLP